MVLKLVFMISGRFLASIWSSGAAKNRGIQDQFMLLCPEGLLGRFGTTLGSILEPFWGHLELIFGVFSKFFDDFSDLFEGCSDVCRFQWPAPLL